MSNVPPGSTPPPGGGDYPPPPPPEGYGYPQVPQGGQLAEWGPRALGLLIDAGIGLGGFVVIAIVGAILGAVSSLLFLIVLAIGYLASFGWSIWLAIQVGQTGATPGMQLIGLKCVGKDTGQPIGAGMGVVRAIAHIVDGLICYIGWLFPLWDAQKQTIADKIVSDLVMVVPKQPFSLAPPSGAAA